MTGQTTEPEPMSWSTAVQVHALAVGPDMLPAVRRTVEQEVAAADRAAGRPPSVHDPADCPWPPCTTRRYRDERDAYERTLATPPLTDAEVEALRERFSRPGGAAGPITVGAQRDEGGGLWIAPLGTGIADDGWQRVSGVTDVRLAPADTRTSVVYHPDGGASASTEGRHGTIVGVLAPDGTSVTVWAPLPDGTHLRMKASPRPPRTWTVAALIRQVERARDSEHEPPLDNVRLRRYPLPAGRVLTVQVNAGPPTWWAPRVRFSREGWSVGWLRRLVIVDVARGVDL